MWKDAFTFQWFFLAINVFIHIQVGYLLLWLFGALYVVFINDVCWMWIYIKETAEQAISVAMIVMDYFSSKFILEFINSISKLIYMGYLRWVLMHCTSATPSRSQYITGKKIWKLWRRRKLIGSGKLAPSGWGQYSYTRG